MRRPRCPIKVHGPIDASESLPLQDLHDKTAHCDGPMSSILAHESDFDISGELFRNLRNDFVLQFAFDVRSVFPEPVRVAHHRSQEVLIVLANVN